MLYKIGVKFRGKASAGNGGKFIVPTHADITLVPTKLGRFFGLRVRRGTARRARADNGDNARDIWAWFWVNTDRWVGWRIESNIEAAPMDDIEDMPIELLLGDGESK